MKFLLLWMIFAQSPANWTIYLRRAGPVRIGMTISDVRRALDDPQAHLAWVGREPDTSECAYLQSSSIPKPLGLMFQKGRLVRIEVREPGVRTASGAGVGDTEDKIKRLYSGRLKIEPHKYLPEKGHYLRYIPVDHADTPYELLFETDGSRVITYRTGTGEAVALVEGCS
jgi:hypothetical protein